MKKSLLCQVAAIFTRTSFGERPASCRNSQQLQMLILQLRRELLHCNQLDIVSELPHIAYFGIIPRIVQTIRSGPSPSLQSRFAVVRI